MNKPFITYTAQVEKLTNEKHLIVTDTNFATTSLKNISYFGLIGGYKHPFIDVQTHKYINNTTINDRVKNWNIYFVTYTIKGSIIVNTPKIPV